MPSEPLSPETIRDALEAGLPGWAFEDDALTKTYTFNSFPEAVSFIVRLAFYAEEMNHHPDLHNVYDRVDIALSTHDAGNKVTQKDLDLAHAIEGFAWT